MRLSPKNKLLARLCLKIQSSQVERMLWCTTIPTRVRQSIKSPIKFLICLKRRTKNFAEFLKKLKECVEALDDFHAITELLERFHKAFPDLSKLDGEPVHKVTPLTATEEQSQAFKRALIRIGNEIDQGNLEIMIALSPTPEGNKESLHSSVKWFEELKRHGCISEDDTELLEDFFRVLTLNEPAAILNEYRGAWAPDDPLPSAPPLEHFPSFPSIDPNNLPQLPPVNHQPPQVALESSPLVPSHPSEPVYPYPSRTVNNYLPGNSSQRHKMVSNNESRLNQPAQHSSPTVAEVRAMRPVVGEEHSSLAPAPRDPQPFLERAGSPTNSLPIDPNVVKQPHQVQVVQQPHQVQVVSASAGKKGPNKELKKHQSIAQSVINANSTASSPTEPASGKIFQEAQSQVPLALPRFRRPVSEEIIQESQPEVNVNNEALSNAASVESNTVESYKQAESREMFGKPVAANQNEHEANNGTPQNSIAVSSVENYTPQDSNEMFGKPAEGQSTGSRFEVVAGVSISKSPQKLADQKSSHAVPRHPREQSSTVPVQQVAAMPGGDREILPLAPSPVFSRSRLKKGNMEPPPSKNMPVTEDTSWTRPGIRESKRLRQKRELPVEEAAVEESEAKRPKPGILDKVFRIFW